jgi:peroxiredoxin
MSENLASSGHLSRSAEDNIVTYVKALANVLLLALACWVLFNNISLSRQLRMYRRAQTSNAFVARGAQLTHVMGFDLDGHFQNINMQAAASPYKVLITFRPRCPSCISHVDDWHRISADLRRQGWQVIWISGADSADTKAFITQHHMNDEDAIIDPDYLAAQALKLETVPQVVVSRENGVVSRAWVGDQPWTEADIVSVRSSAPQR